jgi:membrane protease YdiL (CAAX protease family)
MVGQSSSGVVWKVPAVWRGLFDFLRDPRLPEARIPFGWPAIRQVAILLALDWIVVLIFVILALTAESAGVELPQAIDDDWTVFQTILLVIILAPPLEEVIFRAALSGQRRAITLFVSPVSLVLTLTAVYSAAGPIDPPIQVMMLLAWVAATATVMAFQRNSRSVPQRYHRLFPYAFWISSGVFGLSHVFNYDDPMRLAVLLMVIPQFTGGMMLGYVRVTYGMWANIGQHVTHNAVAVALIYAWPDVFG